MLGSQGDNKSDTSCRFVCTSVCTFVLWCHCCCCRIRLGSSGRSSVRVLFRKCRFLVQFAVVVVEEEEEEERGVCCCYCCCSLRILTSGAVQQHQLRRQQQKKKKQQQAVGSCVVGRPEFSLILCDRHDFMRKHRDIDRDRETERQRDRVESRGYTKLCFVSCCWVPGNDLWQSSRVSTMQLVASRSRAAGLSTFFCDHLGRFPVERLHDSECRRVKILLHSRIDY